ncbi:MAG TPA: hypothetical protein VMH04_04710 [Candidatus Solibacter sp.]|nr:hypothetical protein [Candidatus Solibacter sp.]
MKALETKHKKDISKPGFALCRNQPLWFGRAFRCVLCEPSALSAVKIFYAGSPAASKSRESNAAFSMAAIQKLAPTRPPRNVQMNLGYQGLIIMMEVSPMKSEYPFSPGNPEPAAPLSVPTSRFTDEKISDESGVETKADSAMAPAGLNNPFWN